MKAELILQRGLPGEFIRYCAVGGAAFLADYSVLFILTSLAGINYLFSVLAAFLAGLIINYLLSKKWVFRASATNGVQSFITFTVIGMVGLIITEVLMWLGVSAFEMNYMLVKVGVTGFVLVWNYTARKILVFGGKTPGENVEAAIK